MDGWPWDLLVVGTLGRSLSPSDGGSLSYPVGIKGPPLHDYCEDHKSRTALMHGSVHVLCIPNF